MSENGPYNQPPQNPYGGGDGTGGQPPFGQPQGGPYGDPGTGGQPGYGQQGGPYGDPGTGGQPGYGQPGGPYPGGPGQDHGMYAGGQPPYGPPGGPGGPGGPGYPPQGPPPPQGGGNKAGLWVVIGGGAIIIVLVIAVVVMLVTNGNNGEEVAAGPDDTSQTTDDDDTDDEPVDEETTSVPEGDAGPSGEPPFAVPTEPCEALTEQVSSDFLLSDTGDKSVSDNSARCNSRGDAPEGNDSEASGTLRIIYEVPFSASDSTERAGEDFQRSVDSYTGEGSYPMYEAEHVEESKAIEGLGDEAHFVNTRNDLLGDAIPEAGIMVRSENLNIRIEYQVNDILGDSAAKEALEMPDDIEDMLVNAASDALNLVGS